MSFSAVGCCFASAVLHQTAQACSSIDAHHRNTNILHSMIIARLNSVAIYAFYYFHLEKHKSTLVSAAKHEKRFNRNVK